MMLKKHRINLDERPRSQTITDHARATRSILITFLLNFLKAIAFFLQGDIGCGKSTLLHCLLGFIPYQQGEIRWFDNTCRQEKDFVPLRGKIGICFQHAGDQLFGPTVT